MSEQITQLKQDFTEGLSQISKFWGFPKGMGAIFAVLYLSPSPLSLDELVEQTGLTKGAISTNVRALARMLAIVEAIVGMFYMTVLVARLVAMYSSGRSE